MMVALFGTLLATAMAFVVLYEAEVLSVCALASSRNVIVNVLCV